MKVTPTEISDIKPINASGQKSVTLENPATSECAVTYSYNLVTTSNSGVDVKATLYPLGSQVLNSSSGALKPVEVANIQLDYKCPAYAATFTGMLKISINILNSPTDTLVPLNISCKDFYNNTNRYTYLTVQVPDVSCTYSTNASGTISGFFEVHYKFFAKPGYLSSPSSWYSYGSTLAELGSGNSTTAIPQCPSKSARIEIAKDYLLRTISNSVKPDTAGLEKYFSTDLDALGNTPLSVTIRNDIGVNADGTINAYYKPDEILIFDR